jgi:LytR cell envelope-related transcriptional attenuator
MAATELVDGAHWRVRRRRQQQQVLLIALCALLGLGGLALGTWLRSHGQSADRQVPAAYSPSLPPEGIDVRVLNATSRAGLADTVATDLRRRGFAISGIANATTEFQAQLDNKTAIIITSQERAPAARILARQIPQATVVLSETASKREVELFLGPKFKDLVGLRKSRG